MQREGRRHCQRTDTGGFGPAVRKHLPDVRGRLAAGPQPQLRVDLCPSGCQAGRFCNRRCAQPILRSIEYFDAAFILVIRDPEFPRAEPAPQVAHTLRSSDPPHGSRPPRQRTGRPSSAPHPLFRVHLTRIKSRHNLPIRLPDPPRRRAHCEGSLTSGRFAGRPVPGVAVKMTVGPSRGLYGRIQAVPVR